MIIFTWILLVVSFLICAVCLYASFLSKSKGIVLGVGIFALAVFLFMASILINHWRPL